VATAIIDEEKSAAFVVGDEYVGMTEIAGGDCRPGQQYCL